MFERGLLALLLVQEDPVTQYQMGLLTRYPVAVQQRLRGAPLGHLDRNPVTLGPGRQITHQRGIQLQLHLHRCSNHLGGRQVGLHQTGRVAQQALFPRAERGAALDQPTQYAHVLKKPYRIRADQAVTLELQRQVTEVVRGIQLRLLGRKGLVREPATTARAFATLARERLSPPAARSFAAITEFYLAERFGGHPAATIEAELRALRDSLRT